MALTFCISLSMATGSSGKVAGMNSKNEIGDVLTVYAAEDVKGSKPLFRKFFYAMGIARILPWVAPIEGASGLKGFMVVLEYGAGSISTCAIFGDINGQFRQVLDVEIGKAKSNPPVEVVDLDGDYYPEIVSVDDYRFKKYGDRKGIARVWKWSPKKNRYIQVRESAYADRLKPLSWKETRTMVGINEATVSETRR